jgi:anti-sigma regulatory factor (Ser/Thr protein kinase)
MNSDPSPLPVRAVRPAPRFPWHHFTMRFSSTSCGARLARHLAGERLDAWGIPYGSDAHDVLTLIVAELSANAVRHGRAPGRDFRLQLSAEGATLRVEVTDSRGESIPALAEPSDDPDGGRGLLLVEYLTTSSDWHLRADGPGRTVWAEDVLPAGG